MLYSPHIPLNHPDKLSLAKPAAQGNFTLMMRLTMNIMMMVALYLGAVWVWQNIIPSGIRSHLSAGTRQAVSQISSMAQ